MTKQEATESMRQGNKLTHISFAPYEWISMRGNIIIDENGYESFQNEFWKYRSGAHFETGWSIWPGTLAEIKWPDDSKPYINLQIKG
jgi:hypothetical protein